jgi:hypothetical protein
MPKEQLQVETRNYFPRRDFLKLLTLPLFITSGLNYVVTNEEIMSKSKKKDSKKLPTSETIVFHRFDNNYLNIGVRHDDKDLEEHLKLSMSEINYADCIFLERTWTDTEITTDQGGYFSKASKKITNKGKKVIDFDPQNLFLNQNSEWIGVALSIPTTLLIATKIIKKDVESEQTLLEKITQATPGEFLKRLAILYGISEYETLSPTMMSSAVAFNIKKEFSPLYNLDFSFTADGRSVLMANTILQYRKKYPNQKIVSISGDLHAASIDYYLRRENNLEFRRKIYSIMYSIYIRKNFGEILE